MRIGVRDLAAHTVMAEQRAESSGSHGPPALAAFQRNEPGAGVGARPFQPQIFLEDLDDLGGQWQSAFFVSFAADPHLGIGQLKRLELKSQDLAGAQTIEQHEAHQGEIAEGAKAAPEPGDCVCPERHNDTPGLS